MAVTNVKTITGLRTDSCYTTLADTIKGLSDGRRIVFSPARGNWGDGLINYGTRQFLADHDLEVEECHKRDTLTALKSGALTGSVVLVGGSGAWSRNFQLSRDTAQNVAEQADHVIVLPTSYELSSLGDHYGNVTYFARDNVSSMSNVPQAQFCHDMAFYTELQVPDLPNKLWRIFAMRNDREGHDYGKYFPLNIDLSHLGDADYTFVSPLFNIVNNFDVISTDRMHLAIVGAMLGLKVNLVPGNYFKSTDVYRSSLSTNYPKVKLKSIEEIIQWSS
ncbi:polysaccharide pyruvyl transferase family protein [Brevibacterium aurantiacum]|uniref:Exopolysaccharide biosynthesis protein EpsI, predicted pyruvyl transferase n=1 Tax=Brevibacterium aurantiacum TaxID=273384 RepID=A0A2H1KST7_BREAU|nr:polysaccharide pyruvyl transferase family protein [Brevibacterium aurantiacum]SMY02845.1 Exopolysaccharide biosynthesis protein EpsI, predicted pyruvyl transferase [Brevibacterium aurantiacum]